MHKEWKSSGRSTLRTRSFGSIRGTLFGHHIEQHDAVVDNLVVLQVMKQGDGNDVRPAREVDRRAGHARLLMEFDTSNNLIFGSA